MERPLHRRPGRPKGSTNKPKDDALSRDQLVKLYKRVEHMLDTEHKTYLQSILNGKSGLDALKESELLLRYLSIVVTEALGWALTERKITQELPRLVGEYRMGIKDLEDMRRRREDQKVKHGENDSVVDPTSDVARRRFEDLVGEYTR